MEQDQVPEARLRDSEGNDTTYQLYWPKSDDPNSNSKRDTVLVFTTNEYDEDALRIVSYDDECPYTGSEITPEFQVFSGLDNKELTEGTDYEVSFEGDRVNVGKDKKDLVTMTVTGKGVYDGKETTFKFRIVQARVSADDVSFPDAVGTLEDGTVQFAYTGSEIKPEPVVTVNGLKLEKGKDYTVAHRGRLIKPDFINSGSDKKLRVIIKVARGGNYKSNKVTVNYTIVPKKLTPSVTLSKAAYTYDGKVKAPAVTVKDGKTVLKEGTDYTISYSGDRKSVGKHSVKVTLQGNYEGMGTASFKINPKGTTVSKPKAGKKKMTVKWKPQTAKMASSRITGYQIQYSLKKNFKKAYKPVTVKGYKKNSKVIKKLKKGKTYYVRIRTYKKVNGKNYYSAWSKAKSVKIK